MDPTSPFSIGVPELMIMAIVIGFLGIVIWPWSRICSRAGFSPWLTFAPGRGTQPTG